jgi:hypothetical protein
MKWKDLSLKERKQIYDSVRANNPDATYFDIKEQFDSIPEYEDGIMLQNTNPEYVKWKSTLAPNLNKEVYGYDLYGAFQSNAEQVLEDDGYYHLPSRDPNTNKILKYPSHPTFYLGLTEDIKAGYYPQSRNGRTYTIPAYEDGKGKTINKADLPPEYRTGTPEYFERQRKISGAVNTVQPEAYITPAGYIKDAVNFIEDLGKGDYAGAAIDAALNLIPWGVGKGIKKLKSKVGRIIEGTEVDGVSVHSFAPTQTKKKTKKKTEEDYDSEFSEVLRKDRNSKKYQQEISRTIEQAIFPDERTRELVENVDKTYGTNYKRAYSNIAYKDMTKRGSYVKWGNTDKDGYGQINIKNIKDNVLPTDINDYNIVLDNNIYMPGTANHELGHVADGLAGSRKIQDFDSGKEYITNTYLNYLANSNNTYSSAELRKMGLFDAAGSRSYLLNPTEAKSHMLTLKRSLKDSGKITNWSTPVDENMILEYMRNPTSNKMVKNQYDLYRNKNEYIDRLNKLIPMEILMPLGGAGFVGHELNKE